MSRLHPVSSLLARVALLTLPAAAVFAQGQALTPKLDGPALVEALRQGGYTIILRHAATDDFVPEPGTHVDADCKTQRNLSEKGRAQARDMGRALTKLGIQFDQVLSSPYCRCLETAQLAFGRAESSELLSVGDELSYQEKDARGKKIRELLNQKPAPGKNTVLVTHTGSLLYSFGLQGRPEGIAHVFRPSPFGPASYMGRIEIDEWVDLAGLEPGEP